MQEDIKLNLGCGKNHMEGYLNVDKYGEPDIRLDLESFPWPWEDSSVSEIVLNHVLEHLGQDTETYFSLIKEIYRVSRHQAIVHIAVPHPRHDDFINDPTHVRKITPESIRLFSKKNNEQWIKEGLANSPLGIYLDVDLELEHLTLAPDPVWETLVRENKLSRQEFLQASRKYNNVIKEIRMVVRVIKE